MGVQSVMNTSQGHWFNLWLAPPPIRATTDLASKEDAVFYYRITRTATC